MWILALPAAVFASSHAAGAGGATPSGALPAALNLSVPSAPALDAMGLAASQAVPASSLQTLAYSLLNSYLADGSVQQGVGVTATTSQLGMVPKRTSLVRYFDENNWGERMAYNSQLSFGIAKAANQSQAITKAGIGFSIPIFDRTDWRARGEYQTRFNDGIKDLQLQSIPDPSNMNIATAPTGMMLKVAMEDLDAWKSAFTRLLGSSDVTGASADTIDQANKIVSMTGSLLTAWRDHPPVADSSKTVEQKIQEAFNPISVKVAAFLVDPGYKALKANMDTNIRGKKITALVNQFNSETWNQWHIDLAGATVSQAEGSKAFEQTSYAAWSTLAAPVGKSAQFLAYGKYFKNLYTTIGSMKTADNLTGYSTAGRIRTGNANYGLFAELQYSQATKSTPGKVVSEVFQLGFEYKLGDQWLQMGIGPNIKGGAKFLFGLNISFDTSPKRSLDPMASASSGG